jgi:hypothetical protein
MNNKRHIKLSKKNTKNKTKTKTKKNTKNKTKKMTKNKTKKHKIITNENNILKINKFPKFISFEIYKNKIKNSEHKYLYIPNIFRQKENSSIIPIDYRINNISFRDYHDHWINYKNSLLDNDIFVTELFS